MGFDLSVNQITCDYSPGLPVDNHQVEHLGSRKHFDRPIMNLAAQCLIGAQQQLLSRLTARVECPRYLRPTEAAIIEQSPIFAREGDTLCHALVDDVHTDFGQPKNIGFTRAKISSFDRVIKEPINTVTVIAIVFRGIDPPLRGNRMRATRAVLKAETFDQIPELAESCSRRGSGQA